MMDAWHKIRSILKQRPQIIFLTTLPENMPQNEWCNVSVSYDDVRLVKEVWKGFQKQYLFLGKMKLEPHDPDPCFRNEY